MKTLIFDTHAHYDDNAFESDRDSLLASLAKQGVCGILNAGTNMTSSKKAIELSQKYPYIYSAVGIHPECISDKDINFSDLENLSKNKKVVAIGEIGLDYHYNSDNKALQIDYFEKQILMANKLSLPILVHDREAHNDTLNLLRKHKPKGVVHCFSGSLEMAEEILKLGMFIGVGGVVTFKNAKKLVEVVENIPLESILLETDAPYMAPVPNRGKRCDSSYIKFTAQKVAEIKNKSYEEILSQTKFNAIRLFGLEGDF